MKTLAETSRRASETGGTGWYGTGCRLLALSLLLCIAGCGQKGPLVLPSAIADTGVETRTTG